MNQEFIFIDKKDIYDSYNIDNFVIIDYPYLLENELLNDETNISIDFDRFQESILHSFTKKLEDDIQLYPEYNNSISNNFKDIWNQFTVDFNRSLFTINDKKYNSIGNIQLWLNDINDFEFGINLLLLGNQGSFAIPLEIIYNRFNLFDDFHLGELRNDEKSIISKKMKINIEYSDNCKKIILSKPLRIFKISKSNVIVDLTIQIFQLDIIIETLSKNITMKINWL